MMAIMDIIIGADGADQSSRTDAGQSYVIYGTATNPGTIDLLIALSSTQGFAILGAAEGDFSGSSVASAGDVNNDGYSDIIIGALYADPNSRSYAGQSYVIYGAGIVPSVQPTLNPTLSPTIIPDYSPTSSPTSIPTLHTTSNSTVSPTSLPSNLPEPYSVTAPPTLIPTTTPTIQSTVIPTKTNMPNSFHRKHQAVYYPESIKKNHTKLNNDKYNKINTNSKTNIKPTKFKQKNKSVENKFKHDLHDSHKVTSQNHFEHNKLKKNN